MKRCRWLVSPTCTGLLFLGLSGVTPSVASSQGQSAATDRATFRVRSTRPIGAAYVDVDGLLANSFTRSDGSAGTYEAPVRLLYPAAQKSCTGVGLEDLANGFLYNFGVHDDFWNLHYARRVLTDDFLMRRGVTYASPTWDKKAIDHLGRGHLEHREDGLRVVQDVAAWLRDPSSVTVVGGEEPMCRAVTLVGYGISDSASLLRQLFADGSAPFDAGLVHAAGATCWDFTVGQATTQCPSLPVGLAAKVMAIDSETDLDVQSAASARQDGLVNYRHYEVAGSAHLTKAEGDLMEFARHAEDENPLLALAFRETGRAQNPESLGPVLRTAYDALMRWTTSGTAPPANAYLDGTFDPTGTFTIARDADGNALGGIRLPWLTTTLPDGSTVGAAVARHTGTDATGGFLFGGRYECFTDTTRRYPTAVLYADRVSSGARYAESQRWILAEDGALFERYAANTDLGHLACPPWPDGSVPSRR